MSKEILFRFFEGKTSPKENSTIKAWVESSPTNRQIFSEERKLFDSLILLGRENEKVSPVPSIQKRNVLHYTFLLGRVGVLFFALMGVFNYLTNSPVEEEEIRMQTIYVPVGHRVNLDLPDGTNVWLNGNTTFSYPTHFNKKIREVILTGEAYFDVHPNENHPFWVKTDYGFIEVLGTQFNVETNSNNKTFETTLIEGIVKINLNDDPKESIYLQPAQKAVLAEGKLHTITVTDYNPYRWKDGLICFKDKTLAEILCIFEKYYEQKMVIRNTTVSNLIYSGKFRYSDGLEYALQILQKELNFEYIRDEDNKEILIL